MMEWAIKLALALGVSEKFAKAAAIAAGVALLALVLSLGKCTYDRNLVSGHDVKRQASEATAALAAEHRAIDSDGTIAAANSSADAHMGKAIDDAIKSDPQAGRRPVGPAVGAALGELRGKPKTKPGG